MEPETDIQDALLTDAPEAPASRERELELENARLQGRLEAQPQQQQRQPSPEQVLQDEIAELDTQRKALDPSKGEYWDLGDKLNAKRDQLNAVRLEQMERRNLLDNGRREARSYLQELEGRDG